MYPAFLGALLLLEAPPALAAFLLLFFANLDAGLTHYGTVPAPIIFGVGYVSQGLWWKIGFLVSLVNIAVWLLVGMAWWKIIGLWCDARWSLANGGKLAGKSASECIAI